MSPTVKSTNKCYFSVTHEVSDFEAWKKQFDDHESFRRSFNIKVDYVLRDTRNRNLVTVLAEGPNLQTVKDFFTSPELKEVMEKAGIIGKPEMHIYDTSYEHEDFRENSFVMISHQVKDYENWKHGYDDHELKRKQAGIHMTHVFRDTENKNLVCALGSAKDTNAISSFISDPELKIEMEKAGVIGGPDIHIYSRVN